ERKRKREKWREIIDKAIYACGSRIFFEQEFQAVRGRLQKSVWTDAVRSPAGLNVRDEFAFEPGEIGVDREDDEEKQTDFHNGDEPEVLHQRDQRIFDGVDHDFALASGTDSMACMYRPSVPLVKRESCAGLIKPTGTS